LAAALGVFKQDGLLVTRRYAHGKPPWFCQTWFFPTWQAQSFWFDRCEFSER